MKILKYFLFSIVLLILNFDDLIICVNSQEESTPASYYAEEYYADIYYEDDATTAEPDGNYEYEYYDDEAVTKA
jgi:hypothetical protein